jgi:hypothetical protein
MRAAARAILDDVNLETRVRDCKSTGEQNHVVIATDDVNDFELLDTAMKPAVGWATAIG